MVEERVRKQKLRKERELKIKEVMVVLDELQKQDKENVFETAVNKWSTMKKLERKANKEVANAQKNLERVKKMYGK